MNNTSNRRPLDAGMFYRMQSVTSKSILIGIVLHFLALTLPFGSLKSQTNFYYNGTGSINNVSSWGRNTDGTGTSPTNFTSGSQIFNIRNASAPSTNGNWTVSGTGSKVIVGNGTSSCNFTVGSGHVLSATVDVSASATLTLSTTGSITNITFGSLNASSTVHFASTSAQTVPAVTYGNLTISGTRGNNDVTFAGGCTIAGNLTITASGNSGNGFVYVNNSNSDRTFTINGNYVQTGAIDVEFGGGNGNTTVNLAGNFSKTNGYMVTSTSSLDVQFNLSGSNNTIQCNGGTEAKWIDINILNAAVYTMNGNFSFFGSSGTNAVFTVSNGGRLNTSGFSVLSSGGNTRFVLNAGATLGVSSTAGITTSGASGNIQTSTRTYTAGANYVYNGTAAQATGNGLTANTPAGLTINNSAGVTLSANTAISGTLTLTSGLLNTSTFTMTLNSGGSFSGASSSSFVNGKLARVITTTAATSFPVGKGSSYMPAVFTSASAASRTVTIEYFATGSPISATNTSTARFGTDYWNINQSATGTNYTVALNNGGVTPTGTVLMLRREGTGSTSSNNTTFSNPDYSNATSFSTANASNDVTLVETGIPLTITGLTGNNKVYDRNTTATASGTATLSGVVSPDVVTLSGTPVYTFASENVGSGISITTSGYSITGANAGAYSLTQPTLSGNITPKALTVTASNQAKCAGSTLNFAGTEFTSSGLLSGDAVSSVTLTSDGSSSGAATGTYNIIPTAATGTGLSNYSITYNNGTLTINATPAVPNVSTLAATCTVAGTANISNYSASLTYTFSPTGPSAGTGGAISVLTAGTSYTVTATNTSNCTSAASSSFSVAAQLTTPAVPTISTAAATCSAQGTATISNYSASNTYTFSPTGPTAGASGVVSGLTAGTSYAVTATNTSTCTSAASTSFSVAAQLTTSAAPGSITGSAALCAGKTNNTYSITSVSGATGYTWTVPTGWNITAGQNTNSVTVTSGTGNQDGNITVTANNTCGSSTAATLAVTVTPNTWLGTQNNNWATASNWSCGIVPVSGSDIIISPSATNPPNLTTNITLSDLDIPAGKTFDIGSNTLTLNGTISGEGSLIGSHTSSLVLNGNTGTLRFTQNGTGNFLRNFTLNNGATASLANQLNITAGMSPNMEGVLTVNGSAVLTTNDNLAMKSNSFGTSRIAPNTTSSSYIVGKVSVERFIPQNTYKGWRLLATNTVGSTINQAWQEGQSGSTLNNTPGFGTMITGPAANDSVARTLGFDQRSVGFSLFRYDSETDALVGIANTKNTQLNANSGYFMFIRGDRSPGQFGGGSSNAPASSSTTLRSKGNVIMGTQAPTVVKAGQFALVGNPYASAIDMRTVMNTRSNSSLSRSFQVWDPKLQGGYGFGAYQTFDYNAGSDNYEVTPGGGSFAGASTTELNYVQSGSAFFLQNTGSTQTTITIGESAKAGSSRNAFRPTGNLSADVKFKTNLFTINTNSVDLADGSIIRYDPEFSNAVDSEDVVKSTNFGENFGLYSDNKELTVERRQLPTPADTIFFKMYSLKRLSYRMEFTPTNMPDGMDAFLEDAFTNTSVPVSLTDTSSYTFTVSTVAASAAQNRFRIIFRPQTPLPVTVTEVRASAQSNRVAVEWTVNNQVNLREYRVEHSADGRSFTSIGTVAARNTTAASTAYRFDDAQALSGWNYYRIQCVDNDGRFKYTGIVKVMMGKTAGSITVFPNPVEGGSMNLQLVNQKAGRYTLRMLNAEGRTVLMQTLDHSGGSTARPIVLPGYLANGQYRVEVMGNDKADRTVIPVVVNNK